MVVLSLQFLLLPPFGRRPLLSWRLAETLLSRLAASIMEAMEVGETFHKPRFQGSWAKPILA